MNEPDRKFWPFRPRTSIIWSIALLVGLLFVLTLLKKYGVWVISDKTDTAVLIGIVLVSLLPVLLALVDVIIERGGTIEYGGLKIDFSQIPKFGKSGLTVPTNIGLPNQPLDSSATPDILELLLKTASCDVVIIDLVEGDKWWETRLLVLLSGAVRLKKPGKIVFTGKVAGTDMIFLGWSHPDELLPRLLKDKDHPQYLRSYHAAKASARQWELVVPVEQTDPATPGATPPKFAWMKKNLATIYNFDPFDDRGLPKELLAEQLLAYDLGRKVEGVEEIKRVSLERLGDLFCPVLRKESIDENWPAERQLSVFLNSESDYIAVTQNGKYSAIVSRLTALNAIVRTLIEKSK